MKKKYLLVLLFILIVASVFRLWNLSSVPPSPSLDEVSIGYNAYSILQTGADEYDTKFPLLLRAYDDWRPALYVYLVIPFVWLFGLSVQAVRLPSVLLGVAAVWATYELVKALFDKNWGNNKYWLKKKEIIALVSALLLAISPWHIYLSRLGHEANAGFAFFVFAGTAFLKRRWSLCAIFFGLSFISYQSEKIVVPIMIAGLGMIFFKDLWKIKRKLVVPTIVLLAIIAPFLKASLAPEALVRFKATNVLVSEGPRFIDEHLLFQEAKANGDILGQLTHWRFSVAAQIVSTQYFSHFSPLWLFINNEVSPHAHKAPHMGLVYLWEMFFIAAGLVGVFISILGKKVVWIAKLSRKQSLFVLLWLFSGPTAAAITTQSPHVMRSYTMLPMFQLISALGIVWVFQLLQSRKLLQSKKKLAKSIYIFVIGGLMICGGVGFWKNYFHTFANEQSDSFQYGLSQSIAYALENEDRFEKIVFSNEKHLYQSYMFYLFHSNYNPQQYQDVGGTVSGGYDHLHFVDIFEFRPIQWDNDREENKHTLFIGNYDDFPGQSPLVEFQSLSGEQAVWVVER